MPVALTDFTTDGGVDVDADLIVDDPQWSLYGLDLDQSRAIFVRLTQGTDLSKAPFITASQFEAAEQVLTVSLDDLILASAGLAHPDTLILLFSLGRCGSTLANHIFNTVPGIFALSEPRGFVDLALARTSMPAARAEALIGAVTRFMYRPTQPEATHSLAIKFHSQVLFQAELFYRVFPEARYIFMYRDAKSWADSSSRFQQNLGTPLQMDRDWLQRMWSIKVGDDPARLAGSLDLGAQTFGHGPVLALIWDRHIREYQRLAALGVPFHPLRYDDLNADREASIRALLHHCGLPENNLASALETFARDSQAGTAIQRGGHVIHFSETDYEQVIGTLAREPDPIPWDLRL